MDGHGLVVIEWDDTHTTCWFVCDCGDVGSARSGEYRAARDWRAHVDEQCGAAA